MVVSRVVFFFVCVFSPTASNPKDGGEREGEREREIIYIQEF